MPWRIIGLLVNNMSKLATYKVTVNTKSIDDIVIRALDEEHRKQAGNDLRDNMIDLFNKYIPEDTGKLKARGYYDKVEDLGKSVRITVRYRNDGRMKLNYVMYQYYGKVWGPNMAKFDENNNFVGWGSPRKSKGLKKYPTNRYIGKERTVEIDKGKVVHITGYTKNKNAVPRWLEYCRNTSIWAKFEKEQAEYLVNYFSKFMQPEKNG